VLLDIVGATALGEIAVSGEPHGLVFSPDGARGYVVRRSANEIAIVDTDERRIVKSEFVGERPDMLAISPNGEKLFATIRGENRMVIFSTKDLEVLAEVKTGEEPHGIAYRP
jgi:DNA-binding beta-propeller fold protein YncE